MVPDIYAYIGFISDYHPAGVFVWDRCRYPRLAVEDGRAGELVERAGDPERQADALAALIGECWPYASWNE